MSLNKYALVRSMPRKNHHHHHHHHDLLAWVGVVVEWRGPEGLEASRLKLFPAHLISSPSLRHQLGARGGRVVLWLDSDM